MQTEISELFRNTPEGVEAEKILRSCVHCGFCTSNCPTYRLLGDELDSPRGRIYLIKGLLEGNEATVKTQLHLDRCLTCRSCETHCPSGVEYGHLLDIGRKVIDSRVTRPVLDRVFRFTIRKILPFQRRFGFFLGIGRMLRPLLPGPLKKQVPLKTNNTFSPASYSHHRKVILVEGCVQPALTPATNAATRYVLDKLGITSITVKNEGCCGAIDYHLAASQSAITRIKNNIDSWWPFIEEGVEAIISTASGCGSMIKDYGYILRQDAGYAEKAARVTALVKDISEILVGENLDEFMNNKQASNMNLVFHNPCSLQHGQKLNNLTENLLEKLGFKLTEVPDKVLCCGSAGTYSLLQAKISRQLLEKKVNALESGNPDVIVTANIGCQLYLQQATDVPVKHWIETVAGKLQ